MSATTRILSRRSLRKGKGQFAITSLLIAIMAMMLHVAVVLQTDYRSNTPEIVERLNTEDTSIVLYSQEEAAQAKRVLASDSRVVDYEILSLSTAPASFSYGGSQTQNPYTLLTSHESKPRIGTTSTVEELPTELSDPIWLPYVMKAGGGYDLGDRFTMTIGGVKHRFHIQGFFESPMRDTLSMGAMEFQVTPAQLQKLNSSPGVLPVWHVRVRQTEAAQSDAVTSALTSKIQKATTDSGHADSILLSVGKEMYLSTQMLTANVFAILLASFSVLIAAVVALIVRFVIRSTVVRDMPAFGTLEAAGMTANQVMRAVMTPFAVVALCSATAGGLATVLILPLLKRMMESQSGLHWDPGLSGLGLIVAVAGAFAIVVLTAWLSARRVRKVPPVDALRGGEAAHSFRPNRLPLDSTRGPASILIGIKAGSYARVQNIMVAIVLAIATFAAVFSLAIYTAVLGDARGFTRTLGGNRGAVSVGVGSGQSGVDLRDDLARMSGVDKAIFHDSNIEATTDAGSIALDVSDDAPRVWGKSLYEGRMPARADEIAIGGRLASSMGIGVGDDITISYAGNKATYLVTGLTQSSIRMGLNAVMTVDGLRQAVPSYEPRTVSVYADGTDTATLLDRISSSFAGRYSGIVNSQAYMDSVFSTYVSMSQGLTIGIVSVTVIVVVLVVGLVVASLINRSRRDFGVLKALGFTNRQLSAQMLAAQLPSVGLGTAVGCVLGWALAMPALSMLLEGVGIMHLNADLGIPSVLYVGLVFLVLPTLLILLLMRKTRRIASRDLL